MKKTASFVFLFALLYLFGQNDPALTIKDAGGNTAESYSCGQLPPGNLTLSASAPPFRATDTYSVAADAGFSPYPFTAGTRLNISANNNNFKYIAADIGFSFCFYGASFSKIAIGAPGLITFDTSYLAADKNFVFYQFSRSVPDPFLPPLNAIFGAYQEGLSFDGNGGSDIYTQAIGTAPFRKFVITFYRGLRTSNGASAACSSIRSTTQIVLSETTNTIEVYADIPDPKSCPDSAYQNSVIGIQNADGSFGLSPQNRNTGAWAADKESYTFSPAGSEIGPNSIQWSDPAGVFIGNGRSVTINPAKSGNYTATADYTLCGKDVPLTANFPVTLDPALAAAYDHTEVVCAGTAFSKTFNDMRQTLTSQNPDNFYFTFTDSFGAVQNPGAVPAFGQIYNVKVESKAVPGCVSSAKLRIVSSSTISTVHVCADFKPDYPLYRLSKILVDPNYDGYVTYFLAANPTAAITTLSVPKTDTTTNLLIQFPGCGKQPLQIIWDDTESSKAGAASVYFCHTAPPSATQPEIYTIGDLATNPKYIADMGSTAPHYFFATYNDASQDKANMDYTKAIVSLPVTIPNTPWTTLDTTVYVRFEDGDCFTVQPLQIILVNPSVANGASPMKICDTGNDGTETILLTDRQGTALYNSFFGGENLNVKFFSDAGYSQEITNTNFTVTTNGPNTVYVQMQFAGVTFDGAGCTTRSAVSFQLVPLPAVHTPIIINQNNLCDHNANGYEIFDATSQQGNINSDPQLTFQYFTGYDAASGSFSGYIADPVHIKIYDGRPTTIFVRVSNGNGCVSEAEIKVQYNLAPGAIKLHDAVLVECNPSAATNFDLSEAIPQMFLQAENSVPFSDIKVSYFKNYDPLAETPNGAITQNYTTGNTDVYAEFEGPSGCFSVAKITLKVYPTPVGKIVPYNFCRYDGVQLAALEGPNLFITGTYDDTAPYVYTFYDRDPSDTGAAVLDPNTVIFPQNLTTPANVWFKINITSPNANLCSTNGQIKFTETAPITVDYPGDLGYNICDTGNDNIETISLRGRENDIKKQYPDATFAYYASYPDAPITNPDQYAYNGNVQNFVYVKVSSSAGCSQLIKLTVVLKKTPKFILDQNIVQFCLASEKVNITPNYQPTRDLGLQITNYDWTLPDGSHINGQDNLIGINTAGNYNLTITTDNGCTFSQDFQLQADPTPTIYKLAVEDKTVKVLATKDPAIANAILYRMDAGNWQTGYIFENVPPGVHTFSVKYDVSDCAGFPMQTLVLAGNNVITPNGDGKNDTFTIDHLDIFPGSSLLQIFDRYGKEVYSQTSGNTLSWDGKYIGRPLPTASYWYVLKISDGRELTGWIVVKNE